MTNDERNPNDETRNLKAVRNPEEQKQKKEAKIYGHGEHGF